MAFVFDTEIRVSIDWTQNSSAKDATTTLYVEPPGSTATLYTSTSGVAHPSTGHYYFDLDGDIEGIWEYRWVAASPKGAAEGYFSVEPSRIDSLNP